MHATVLRRRLVVSRFGVRVVVSIVSVKVLVLIEVDVCVQNVKSSEEERHVDQKVLHIIGRGNNSYF